MSKTTQMQSIHTEVVKFKAWANSLDCESRHGEWEIDYLDWSNLYDAATQAIVALSIESSDEQLESDLFYAIARDNEGEVIAETLAAYPAKLLYLAERSRELGEADAIWQLAAQLGNLEDNTAAAERLLWNFFNDDSEYVRRRALMSLGKLQSPLVEKLAIVAWGSGDQYQRIAALCALDDCGSPMLEDYLKRADEDGREYLVYNANRIRSGDQQE